MFKFDLHYSDYIEDTLGVLGFSPSSPFLNEDVLLMAKSHIVYVEGVIYRFYPDYEGLLSKIASETDPGVLAAYEFERDTILNASAHLLAGRLAIYVMPVTVPKYMSDNKVVFDRFRNVDFGELGRNLWDIGVGLLIPFSSVDTAPLVTGALPLIDEITGLAND